MVAVAVDAALVADSSQSAVVLMAWAVAATPTGDSGIAANMGVATDIAAVMVGGAQLAVDPVGLVLVHAAQSSGVPATAKPPTIPTIRITPPAPPSPSFIVSANPLRRREER